MDTVLVVGATGSIGSELVPALLRRGVGVRAMVRRAVPPVQSEGDQEGVETVIADLDDPATVRAALAGVDAAFLNTPSSEHAAARQIRFIDLARAAGLQRLVLLSQYAAAEDSPVRFLRWHAEVEHHLKESGIGATVLRPNLFFQGVLAFAETIRRYGRFSASIGDAAVSAIDVSDIAEVAAVTLTESGHEGRVYTLTGPRAVTHSEIAAGLSAATGREIVVDDVTPEAFAAAIDGSLPPWQCGGVIEDYAHYARGEAAEVTDSVRAVTGRSPRDLESFAHAVAPALLPAN